MKEYIGKSCKIHVKRNGNDLYFTASQVTSVSNTHMTFIDKFKKVLSFRLDDIEQVVLLD